LLSIPSIDDFLELESAKSPPLPDKWLKVIQNDGDNFIEIKILLVNLL